MAAKFFQSKIEIPANNSGFGRLSSGELEPDLPDDVHARLYPLTPRVSQIKRVKVRR